MLMCELQNMDGFLVAMYRKQDKKRKTHTNVNMYRSKKPVLGSVNGDKAAQFCFRKNLQLLCGRNLKCAVVTLVVASS